MRKIKSISDLEKLRKSIVEKQKEYEVARLRVRRHWMSCLRV